MSAQLQQAIDDLGRAFNTFREKNDQRLKEIEAKGQASAETITAVEKSNAAITELKAKIDELQKQQREIETAQARLAPAGSPEAVAKERDDARRFFATARRTPINRLQVADADLESYRAYRNAFGEFLRRANQALEVPEIRAALSVGVDPAGGYLVPTDMTGRIVEFVYETSPMRDLANVVTTSRKEREGFYDLDEADSGWVGEQGSRGETETPDWAKYTISVHEQYANPRTTQTELDDADFDVEGWLARKVASKLSRRENTGFVNGNGVLKPRGFLTYPAGVPAATSMAAFAVIEQVNTGAAGAFAAANPADVFLTTMGKLKTAYRQGAAWVCNRGTGAEIRKLKDGQGRYLLIPDFSNGFSERLLGAPLRDDFEDMPAIAANSLSIGYGNFREGYEIVDRLGIRVLRDPYTAKPWVQFYTTKRVGGDVLNFEAIKLIKFAA